jgi:hypothetical protein
MRKSDEDLRDEYAGLAMLALMIAREGMGNPRYLAKDAFEMADEMVDRRLEMPDFVDDE